MAVNLNRNTRVYFSTTEAPSLATTTEIQVLDGYTFSQAVEAAVIQVSEAGQKPVRGQRSFNSKLNPVEWNISTYVRPYYAASKVTCPERLLWNAMMGAKAIDTTAGIALTTPFVTITSPTAAQNTYTATINATGHGLTAADEGSSITISGITGGNLEVNGTWTMLQYISATQFVIDLDTTTAPTTGTPVYTSAKLFKGQWIETANSAYTTTQGSNVNELQRFWLFFVVDNSTYRIDRCAVNQAEMTFDLTGISSISWSGFGTALVDVTGTVTITPGTNATAFAVAANADTFITNKLSTIVLKSSINGSVSPTTYTVPITGGTFTYSNNIEYVTPEILGAVNSAIGYFTGTRSVSGNLTAYLKTGTNESAQLLKDMLLAAATTSETKYLLEIAVGGKSNQTRVELLMPGTSLQIPSIDVQDVVSTTINFNAQGYYLGTTPGYDLSQANDLVVSYFHAP